MRYFLISLATRWGRAEGGINVFNKDLITAVAATMSTEAKCVCFTSGTEDICNDPNIELVVYEDRSSGSVTAHQVTQLVGRDEKAELIILGHDVHTGELAISTCKELRKIFKGTVKSAVIRHMHYSQYSEFKGISSSEVEQRALRQSRLVDEADYVFAVGPLLSATAKGRYQKEVCALIPGAPPIDALEGPQELAWQVFMSGRLGGNDDRIKNTTLAIEGLIAGYRTIKRVGGSAAVRFEPRGRFRLLGTQFGNDATNSFIERAGAHFEIEALPYTDSEQHLYQILGRSHWAVMPSWHEGFGLSGWEAICAGVPLICSQHSGLFGLLQNHVFPKNVDIHRESIVPITLAGSGQGEPPSPKDIETVGDAIIEMSKTFDRRKSDAIKLARFLRQAYTWDRCARDFLDHLKWVLPSSVRWADRQRIADDRSLDKPLDDDALVQLALKTADQGLIFAEWGSVCSALNILARWGKVAKGPIAHRALTHLKQISNALENALPSRAAPDQRMGDMDVMWRYLSAASSIAPTFAAFNSLIKPALWEAISQDNFLLREFFYYSCRFALVIDGETDDALVSRLNSLPDALHRVSVQQRLGRLAARHPTFCAALNEAGLLANAPALQASMEAAQRFLNAPHSIGSMICDNPETAGAAVWLLAEGAIQSAHGPRLTIDFVEETQNTKFVARRWRGDKRYDLASLLSALPAKIVLPVLKTLSHDEDEGVRWACLDLIFSKSLRARIDIHGVAPSSNIYSTNLNAELGRIVDDAVAFDGSHPWLQREFLGLISKELTRDSSTFRNFTLNDFPKSRTLLGRSIHDPVPRGPLHPEVEDLKRAARQHCDRVLLVLPPIDQLDKLHAASKTTTPPLGLGLVASSLLKEGHDVELADCHRFPPLAELVVDLADEYDWIGFNVVLSTAQSTLEIASKIRERTSTPYIVIGGPIVNMGAWHAAGSRAHKDSWDFAIDGGNEETFGNLIETSRGEGLWTQVSGVSANAENTLLWNTHCAEWTSALARTKQQQISRVWVLQENIDRRVFVGSSGIYEPGKTRRINDSSVEAHVVMSRGCNWRCTFCTERFQLSGGERRRTVGSVVEELRGLAAKYSDLRIQFIDDNLLPQIGSTDNKVEIAEGVEWATVFLQGLRDIYQKQVTDFGWRGIFRFDDFLAYERELGTPLIEALLASGCRMLAFGIEHGNEKQRQRSKVSDLSNDKVLDVLSRLRAAGIATKGYFIIGGPTETEESAAATIDFALSCGVSLAYFAIYKDFVKAAHDLRGNAVDSASSAEKFLSYKQLWIDLDTLLADQNQESEATQSILLRKMANIGWIQPSEARSIYNELRRLGFNFSDLVKYNDYHSDEGASREIFARNALNNTELYFDMLRSAYLRFYLRPEFVNEYEKLISAGY